MQFFRVISNSIQHQSLSQRLPMLNKCSLYGFASKPSDSTAQNQEPILIPPKPKKPSGPFFRFLASVKDDIVKNNPEFKYKDVVKTASELWRSSDDETRELYVQAYHVDADLYHKELSKYHENLTDEQRKFINDQEILKVKKKNRRELKKKMLDLGKPVKPPTAYSMYLTSRFASNNDIPATEFMKIIAAEWKVMSSEEKENLQKKANDEMRKYQTELAAWEDKMVEGDDKKNKETLSEIYDNTNNEENNKGLVIEKIESRSNSLEIIDEEQKELLKIIEKHEITEADIRKFEKWEKLAIIARPYFVLYAMVVISVLLVGILFST